VQLCSRFVGIEAGLPPDRAQRNFTDPDSRIQPLRSKAVIAGYNAQISIDGAHQIIVAQRLQTSSADARALPGLLADIRAVLGANPEEVSADAGYCDEQNLRHLARRRMDGYIAPGRARHGEKHTAGSRRWPKGSRKPVTATKLKRAARRSRYRLRKQIVEPMLGQLRQARGFRKFLPRGLNKVRGEWAMVLYRPQPAQAGQSHRVISRPYRLPRTQCLVTCLPHSFRSRAPSQKFLLSSTTANNVVPWSKAVRISCSSRFGTTWGHPRRFVSKRPKGSAPSPPAPPIASQNLSRGQGAP
jgi:Transposase DDE domain